MKAIILTAAAALTLVGCASHRGGSSMDNDTYYGTGTGSDSWPPTGSTMRPGINSDDIRDPNALTRPLAPMPGIPPR